MSVFGLLLAGGASSRFGSEKAAAPRGAGRLMDAPLQALIGACDLVAIAAKARSEAARLASVADYEVLADPEDVPAGPLAGVLAGLEWARAAGADHLVTAPCDAALLSVEQIVGLIAAAKDGAAVAASPRGLQPLIAVWPVERGLAALRGHLEAGRHPPVRDVLAELGSATLTGFEDVNINSPADLAALGEAAPPAEEHARLFGFEDDFVRTLRCVPMCVRFKLDRVGVKLTLRQWSRFTLADRERLRALPCETDAEVGAWREALVELIRLRSGETAGALPPQPAPAWTAETTPSEVAAFAEARGARAPSDGEWRGMSRLERYALVKLTRDKHENANFVPAMREFGLL
jgi:molybdopterin-guanine dinucleotide biosynthesis protein A